MAFVVTSLLLSAVSTTARLAKPLDRLKQKYAAFNQRMVRHKAHGLSFVIKGRVKANSRASKHSS
jgi:hypothetical protein